MAEETQDFTFNVSEAARLRLGNIRGSVDIAPGDDGVIRISVVKHTDTGNARDTEVRVLQEEDGSVTAETRFDHHNGWLFNGTPCKVDYTVRVPRRCSANVSGVSNRASVAGLQGELHLTTVSGEVELREVNGPMHFNAVSGGVHGARLSGPLALETVSGKVQLEECTFPEANISTVSGGIWIDTDLASGPYRFKSVSGGLHLVVPAESALSVSMSSLSGRIHTSLPADIRSSERRHGPGGKITADLNGGGVEVHLNSVSGNLEIEPRGGAPAPVEENPEAQAAPTPPAAEAQKASTLDILKQVESGDITVEEAMKRLS